MNKVLKHTLVAIVSLIGLYLLCLGVRGFLFADFFSGPSEKECVKIAERFLGCKLGKDYEILEYDVDYSHPDRPLFISIKLPPQRYEKVAAFCEDEASKGLDRIREKDGGHDIITTPLHKTMEGYQKFEEVLWLGDRVHYKSLYVIPDERIVSFSWMDF